MRQLIRLRDVRAPSNPNADQLSQGEVREVAETAQTYEEYNSAVISQIRLVAGSDGWTQPPAPTDGDTNGNGYPSGREVFGEVPVGAMDGVNAEFLLSNYANPSTVRLYYNSLRLGYGLDLDFVAFETVLGQGYNRIRLTGAIPPRARDRLYVDYVRI